MIENEFEVKIILENELTQETLTRPATFEFNDIEYFYKEKYKDVEITAMHHINGETILVDMKYADFKEKYNKHRKEIKDREGQRPKH